MTQPLGPSEYQSVAQPVQLYYPQPPKKKYYSLKLVAILASAATVLGLGVATLVTQPWSSSLSATDRYLVQLDNSEATSSLIALGKAVCSTGLSKTNVESAASQESLSIAEADAIYDAAHANLC